MRAKRTLKLYRELFHNPFRLFGGAADDSGAKVTLWPNGEREIWIQGSGGKGFRVTAGEGPAGLSLHISTFVGSPPITVTGNAAGDYQPLPNMPDARHLSLCQYNGDDKSQAFKRWYLDHSDGKTAPLADDIYPIGAQPKG